MRFFVKFGEKGFRLAIQPSSDLSSLKKQILNSDVLISDLDDTDLPSPAKKIAWNSLRSIKILNPNFFFWCCKTGYKLFKNGKSAEPKAWQEYTKLFLRNAKEIKRAKEKFTEQEIEKMLYPGVKELYSLLPERIYKLYLTRNILEIGWLFAKFLNFDQVIAEIFDKAEVTEQFVIANPQFKNYFVKGDSEEDEAILDVLELYKRKDKIENIISCYRADSSAKANERFDINVGKDYRGLVELLRWA